MTRREEPKGRSDSGKADDGKADKELKEGRVVAIAGPVVDVEFPLHHQRDHGDRGRRRRHVQELTVLSAVNPPRTPKEHRP